MKKILYFFPHNPLEKNSGCKTRALNLLLYFKKRNFQVDFLGIYHKGSDWFQQDINHFQSSGLVRNVDILKEKPVRENPIKRFLNYKLPKYLYQRKLKIQESIPNYATYYIKFQFDNLLKRETYDYIIISYAYWADLIRNNPLTGTAKTIIDTHDFLTAQHQSDEGFILGSAFQDEIRRLMLFDEVWAISTDEEYIFNQFCKNKIRLIPVMLDQPHTIIPIAENKQYDLLYIASDNQHNIRSAKWFFEEVYPLLPTNINICVIGAVIKHIDISYLNVTNVIFAEDIDQYYSKTKVVICPMLTGTGVKVKVVEALSYGLPVVCTSRGVDGLPNKTNNGCLVSNNAKQFAENILSLLNDPAFYQKQCVLSKELFDINFKQSKCYKNLDEAFENC